MSPSTAIVVAIFLPLAAAPVIALLGSRPNVREGVTLVTGGMLFLVVGSLFPLVLGGARPAVELVDIMPGLSVGFAVEPLGMLFALTASGLWIVTSGYAIGYMRGHHEENQSRFYAFFSHDSGIRCKEAPKNMLVAMALGAPICVFNGCFPGTLYSLLPYPVDYEPYTPTHVVQQWQILFFSALAFAILKLTGIYPPELRSVNLYVDWFYRRLLPGTVKVVNQVGGAAIAGFFTSSKALGRRRYFGSPAPPRSRWCVRQNLAHEQQRPRRRNRFDRLSPDELLSL